jgi:Uma2 family endonuclease
MSAGVLISLEEYLATDYSPDREFVDGLVMERHVGERPHSIVQSNVIFELRQRYRHLCVWPEQRIRTLAGRCRIPDVLIALSDPGTAILEEPPFVVVEILSASDGMSDVLEKLEEYRAIGVPNIWLLDPKRAMAYRFGSSGLEQVREELAAESPEIRLELDEVFRGL